VADVAFMAVASIAVGFMEVALPPSTERFMRWLFPSWLVPQHGFVGFA